MLIEYSLNKSTNTFYYQTSYRKYWRGTVKNSKENKCVIDSYTGCNRNTFHILNCHQCGASEFRQVLMIAPSS